MPTPKGNEIRSQDLRDAIDIPLARRTHTHKSSIPNKRVSKLSLIIFYGIFIFLGLGLVTWFFLHFRSVSSGLTALRQSPSADGRLLGHFPYPEAKSVQLRSIGQRFYLRPDAATSFEAMQYAASKDGVKLTLLSAFRSIEDQKKLFFDVKADRNQSSSDRAQVSAPPGFSEHSTGFAVDIGDFDQPETNLSTSFATTKAYLWLKNNSARFHFALSFPQNNPQGVSFEPWHWRFEGSTEALRLFEPSHRLRASKKP